VRVAFYTLGCKLNQSETESISAAFSESGWSVVPLSEGADLFIINTCTVTSKSEQKARRIIRKISGENSRAVMIITGCYAQMNPEELKSLGSDVFVLPLDRKEELLDLPGRLALCSREICPQELSLEVGRILGTEVEIPEVEIPEAEIPEAEIPTPEDSRKASRFRFLPQSTSEHVRGFVKIQDGCNNRCAYCRVPLARGNSVSLQSKEVIQRIQSLESRGVREAVLTGVNISQYRDGGLNFTDLLSRILSETSQIRIRLSSLEPETIDENLGSVLEHSRLCPHFHIPVQSGSSKILNRMRRKYTPRVVEEGIGILRQAKKDPFIAADIIVGFPGEGEEDFLDTLNLFENLDFSFGHIFPFSPRPGTEAYNLTPKIPERISRERADLLQQKSLLQHNRYIQRFVNRELSFLVESLKKVSPGDGGWGGWVEGSEKSPLWLGTTENYLKPVVRGAPESGCLGEVWQVRLEEFDPAFPQKVSALFLRKQEP